jgi:ubiquinone biosynthesis protein
MSPSFAAAVGGAPARVGARALGGAAGLRHRLERLGPTYLKIGQLLALRPDLISRDYSDELMHLLDRVPPFPWEQARNTIETDLGAPLPELFAHVDPRPIAAGALSQTHVARCHDGSEVAVKVQRPGIAERVERDLSRASLFARVLEGTGVKLLISPVELLEELNRLMTQELDFTHELENVERLRDLAEGSPYERIPEPYPDLSGPRIVTSEYLRGIPFSELVASVRSGTPAELERLERLGLDPDGVAHALIASVLRQIFLYRFFHSDVHPGNVLALPDGRIGFTGFGLCEELDSRVREKQLNYLYAANNQNVDLMFDSLLDILVPGPETDIAAFRRDFGAETRRWISKIKPDQGDHHAEGAHVISLEAIRARNGRNGAHHLDDDGPSDTVIAQWLMGTMQIVRRHGLQLPARVISMHRTMLTAESVARDLGASADIRSVGEEFFTRLRIKEELRSMAPDHFGPSLSSALSLVRDGPRQLQRVLSDLSEGRLAMTMAVDEVPRTAAAWRRRTNLLSTSILTIGLSILLAAGNLPTLVGIHLSTVLSVVLVALYVSAFLQWRRLR